MKDILVHNHMKAEVERGERRVHNHGISILLLCNERVALKMYRLPMLTYHAVPQSEISL